MGTVRRDARLLTNIVACTPIKVKGVNSSDKCLVVVRLQGLSQNAIHGYFSKDASANIISYCQLDDPLGIIAGKFSDRFINIQ
jgi:hypothetical protein